MYLFRNTDLVQERLTSLNYPIGDPMVAIMVYQLPLIDYDPLLKYDYSMKGRGRHRRLNFSWFSRETRGNEYLVLMAVKEDDLNLRKTSIPFGEVTPRKKRTVVEAAVHQNGLALEFAFPQLKHDPDIVEIAVRQNGLALQFASAKWRDNHRIVALAAHQNIDALQYASPRYRRMTREELFTHDLGYMDRRSF